MNLFMRRIIISKPLERPVFPEIAIIKMSCGEWKTAVMRYSFYETIFGTALIASTTKGICFLAVGNEIVMLTEMEQRYPSVTFVKQSDEFQLSAKALINSETPSLKLLPLHIKGTDFQMVVWEALLHIPFGSSVSYREIAEQIGKPKSYRAVASAIGNNPVAYLIPCHRVVRSDGQFGGYRWGIDYKKRMIAYESVLNNARCK